jgi:predicted enzyme related to lactoylglutathione lyase
MTFHARQYRTFLCICVAGVVAAASGDAGRAADDSGPPSAAACAALTSATFTAVTLTALTASYDAGSATQPAHCVVRGSAAPHTGVDGKHYETRFELRLPTTWSGRFLYQGGGGNDGTVAPAVGRNTGSFPETALQRGFAVVTTDAGHQGATPEFGLDPTARLDHAYAAHERTYTIAITIMSRYFGRAPDRKYFVGCSGGGRQGMMFAQRYPAYFDGVAICAPAMSVSSGATIAAAWDTQTYLSAAPAGADGNRVLSRAFSDGNLTLVARGIIAACDAADGATDGMVLRPDACRFDPKTLLCAGDKAASCLTSGQVAALERAFGGPRNSSGRPLYVGQMWDPGIAAAGWRQWKLGSSQTSTPNAANATLMAGALAHEFFTPPDPAFAITRFDFDRDPARTEPFSAIFDTYRDAALSAFRARGGKLLIFHGTADPIFSALESIDYYRRLTQSSGGPEAAARWARLFLVPGMNHCAGGPATDSFDGLGAIVNWVEKGVAPARIEASASARPAATSFPGFPGLPGRTRPLCPYPSYARYSGTGSLEDSANFACESATVSNAPVRGLYNWIHGTGDAERAFAFYRDVFGIELARSPFAGAASTDARPEPIRPAAQAGSDPLVWDLTNTHGSRFRTVFMRAPNTPFGLELSEFFDIPREERQPNPWDPGASTLVFAVRDLDAVVNRLKARGAPVVTLDGGPVTTPGGRAILVRDPDGCLIEVRQTDVIETSIGITVANLARAREFYEKLLGFTVDATRTASAAELRVRGLSGGRLTETQLTVPGTGVHVVLSEFTLPAGTLPRARRFDWKLQDVGSPQFQLAVSGLDTLIDRTRRAGYRFLSVGGKPIQRVFGRFVFAIGPDAVLVEFVEPAASQQ